MPSAYKIRHPAKKKKAVCAFCHQRMDNHCDDCGANRLVEFPDGKTIPAERWKPEGWVEGQSYDYRCHDCNITAGHYHHPGCDMERCPRCGGQLIACGCLDEADDDDDLENLF